MELVNVRIVKMDKNKFDLIKEFVISMLLSEGIDDDYYASRLTESLYNEMINISSELSTV